MTAVPLVLSLVAIVISLLALWKTHFSPFSPLAVAGPRLTLRIYPIQTRASAMVHCKPERSDQHYQ
jgi:hypothetical protein